MADVYKGLTVRLGVDSSSLSRGLRKSKSEVRGVSSDLKLLSKALKADPSNANLLAQQQKDYRRAISATMDQLEMLAQAERQLKHEMSDSFVGPVDKAAQHDQWTRLQSDIVMTEQKLKGYKQALADSIVQQNLAASRLDRFGQSVKNTGDRLVSVGRRIEGVGSSLTTGVTVPMAAAGAATIAAAASIDTSLTNVKKTVNGTDEQYLKLKQSAIEFSQTNAVSASQILDIQALGAQLGFAIDELDEFGRVVSGLDIATNMNAEQAGTEMAQFANITKMNRSEISNYGSAIVGLGNSFATTESDISSMAMRIAASGTQVGMSQADILGLAAALSAMGVEAEAGGTAVSTIMAQIDKDVATNSASVETWASTAGMSAQEFADAWRNAPVDALSALLSNMESTTAEGGNMSVMLQELGIDGVRQTDIMKRLAGNSELVGSAVAKSNEEWTKNTALSKEVENRNQSLAAKFEMLKNRAIAIAESVGGPLADALLEAMDAAEPLVKAISDGAKAFSEMDDGQQRAIVAALALAAALGPVLKTTGKVSSAVGKLAEKLGDGSRDAAKLSAEASAVGVKAKVASVGVRALSAATKALKAAAGALAFVLVMAAAEKAAERLYSMKQRSDAASGATDGLREAVDAMNSSLSGAVPVIDSATGKTEELASSAYDAMKKQADLADEMKKSWQDVNTDKALIEEYMGVIEQLTGKYDENGNKAALTKEEQAKLQAAVAGVNEVCGTSYSVVDAQNGILSESTGAIKSNTEAWVANADAQAAQEQMVEMKKQWYDLDRQRHDLNKEIAEDEARLNELNGRRTDLTRAEASEQQHLVNKLEESKVARDDLTKSMGENEEYQKRLIGKASEAQDALSRTAPKLEELIAKNREWSEALADSGIDVAAFSQKLSELGYSTSDLASMSTEQLTALAGAYGSNTADIIAMCGQMGIAVPQKMREAVTGATQEVAAETPNAASAMLLFKDGMLQSYDPVTGQFSQVTNDALAQITGGIAAGAPSVDTAVMTMRDGMLYTYDPLTRMFVEATDSAMDAAASAVESGTPPVRSATAGLVEGVDYETGQMPGKVADNTEEAGNALVAGIDAAQGSVASSADAVSKLAADRMSSASKDAWWAGHNMAADSFKSGVDGGRGQAVGAADAASKLVADHFSSANGDAWWAGRNMSAGFAKGISDGGSIAVEAAASVARDAINAAKAEADIHSPSRVMEEAGEFFTEGWAIGIGNKTRMAIESVRKMVDSTILAVPASAGIGSVKMSALAKTPASSGAVNVTVEQSGGITEEGVYNAMAAAIAAAGGREVSVYVDGKKLASSIAQPIGAELARVENLRRW